MKCNKIASVIIATSLLAACSTTPEKSRYELLESDIAVMCKGNTTGIEYQDTLYSTVVKCDGKTFTLSKDIKTTSHSKYKDNWWMGAYVVLLLAFGIGG